MATKQFGGKITDHWKSKYQASPNWRDGSFKNLVETQTAINWRQLPGIICKQFKGHNEGSPLTELPVAPLNPELFAQTSERAKFVWYGHSVVLMRLNNQIILIDPMLATTRRPLVRNEPKGSPITPWNLSTICRKST